jgi:hypothetical protein
MPDTLNIFDFEEIFEDLAANHRPPDRIWLSAETIATIRYWVRRSRRQAKRKATMARRRAIGRGRW